MSPNKILLPGALVSFALLISAPVVPDEQDGSMESRGKYIVEIGGCNDCHTPGFGVAEGTTPESEWLLGDSLGFRGPWGTTYPPNLRAYMGKLTEDQWVTVARVLKTRPPMPFWAVNSMTEEDLRAVYRFIRTLDPVDSEIPLYVPPDQTPAMPYILWPSPPE